ncbi:tobamovirus multiplication protein 1-like isoform X2 [Mangifera indica]|uniref:tobamovirus multiplication protein 1-like isoform X2 n=1 Tax=Mangifera indica TaxID=29780 RepID=UPI001CFA828B|nr:tobamovirus multiplication protein 1-like isoform X2 [Mangifera indica]
MLEIREGSCLPRVLVGVNVGLVCVGSIIAILAFSQLIRIHLRNSQLGWTRQKVLHLLIGSSNVGYFLFFVLTLVAACYDWPCWSYSCGFIAMAIPRILLFSAFLLLLSFWIDLCHQADDEEEDDDDEYGFLQALLKRSLFQPSSSSADNQRICFPFQSIHVGSRQKIVILVTVLIFLVMITFAVVIWIGMGNDAIKSSVVAQVYVALFAIAKLLLGGALAYYGLLLCLKIRTVRSERASSETWKIAGLAVVSVLCFTPSAIIALSTTIPAVYHWQDLQINGVYTTVLLIVYYFVVPSAFVLWVMRELPALAVNIREDESRTIAFIHDSSAAAIHQPGHWTTGTSTQSEILSVSPV